MSDLESNVEVVAKAAVMNQLPADGSGVRAESPLFHAELEVLAKQGPQQGGVHLRENKLQGHLTLRCNQNNPDQLAAVETVLGLALPIQPLTAVVKGDISIRWMSPDEWLIVVPGEQTFDIESCFRDVMTGHYSLVNGSGGQTIIELWGPDVVSLLKKCTPIDFHPTQFPVGKVVSSIFAKSGAVISRTGEDRFELVIRRSFADYLWLWLQDASREYGLVIEV
ncbi:sarcosine oxidase subunit gamma [Neptunomonas antarctica]|uniref:Sarcosine oxidase subunit gamma n=1 Tax=Neptunomonas antarctica TaxID=619304 RepID=A0A1N7K3Y2_9GAMM|nr:sarcosine oxidase subunit gamma family protein [Neptunomonas antarctica]SIS56305.1 sarcosine oxidase subunit gamma [Neptunomonas antarctica]